MRYIFWTIIVVVVSFFYINSIIEDQHIVGNGQVDFVVGEEYEISIDGNLQAVSVTAASPGFFIVRNTDNVENPPLLIGVNSEKPLGWRDAEYFKSQSVTIDTFAWNQWKVEKGSDITLLVESESLIRVTLYLTESAKFSTTVIWMIICFFLWIFGCVVISE